MRAVEEVNERQKHVLFEKIHRHFNGELQGNRFAVWGLSFKPNTDDLREAPSQVVFDKLLNAGASVRAYDPEARNKARLLYSDSTGVQILDSRDQVLDDADGLIVMTEWNEFRSPDFNQIREKLRECVVFDGRNLFEPRFVQQLGIPYYGIGRGL